MLLSVTANPQGLSVQVSLLVLVLVQFTRLSHVSCHVLNVALQGRTVHLSALQTWPRLILFFVRGDSGPSSLSTPPLPCPPLPLTYLPGRTPTVVKSSFPRTLHLGTCPWPGQTQPRLERFHFECMTATLKQSRAGLALPSSPLCPWCVHRLALPGDCCVPDLLSLHSQPITLFSTSQQKQGPSEESCGLPAAHLCCLSSLLLIRLPAQPAVMLYFRPSLKTEVKM